MSQIYGNAYRTLLIIIVAFCMIIGLPKQKAHADTATIAKGVAQAVGTYIGHSSSSNTDEFASNDVSAEELCYVMHSSSPPHVAHSMCSGLSDPIVTDYIKNQSEDDQIISHMINTFPAPSTCPSINESGSYDDMIPGALIINMDAGSEELSPCEVDRKAQRDFIKEHRNELLSIYRDTIKTISNLLDTLNDDALSVDVVLVNSNLLGDNQTITNGIDSVTDRGLIVVGAGNYEETLRIDTPVIIAALDGKVVIGRQSIASAASVTRTNLADSSNGNQPIEQSVSDTLIALTPATTSEVNLLSSEGEIQTIFLPMISQKVEAVTVTKGTQNVADEASVDAIKANITKEESLGALIPTLYLSVIISKQ